MTRRAPVYGLLLVLLGLITAQACGPDFFPDVFVLKMRPDKPKEFAAGKLGILLPTYPRADLAVAFRYLNGGSLSRAEQRAYEPMYALGDPGWEDRWNTNEQDSKEPSPADLWRSARAKYANPEPEIGVQREEKIKRADGSTYVVNYENCHGNAFDIARETLEARVKLWGAKSAELADWIKGQDTVFSNCGEGPLTLPGAAPAGSSELLKADRAYQIAAAQFYAQELGDARKGFEAIGQDPNSPWRGIARYVAARCLVREAFYAGKARDGGNAATFDAELMRQAAELLRSLLKEKLPGVSRRTVQDELDMVEMRIDPMNQMRRLARAVAGPESDAAYEHHLTDLCWYLDNHLDEKAVRADVSTWYLQREDASQHGVVPTADARARLFSKTYAELAPLRATSPLVDWLITFQSPAKETAEHALSEWEKTHTQYWLVAALAKATEKDAQAEALVAAAGEVMPGDPAWEMVTYHRLRLMIALGHASEARGMLDQLFAQIKQSGRDSSMNAFLGLRMSAAPSLGEFLTFAPRKMLDHESEAESSRSECLEVMKDPKRHYDCERHLGMTQFSEDAAGFMNGEAPVATLADVAESASLPDQLRRSVAMMGWVRAVLLKDDAAAARLFPLLPEKLRQQAGAPTGFRALVTLVRNPGLRPYLDSGVQRAYSYDFVESYSDNWWCRNWDSERNWGPAAFMGKTQAAFLGAERRSAGERETAELLQQGAAETQLGNLVLEYAEAHPADRDVPEALFLVLRMLRYGCEHGGYDDTAEGKREQSSIKAVGRGASRLLRQRYAVSPWTKKAAPIAW